MLSGAVAGLVAFIFARIFAEPLIDRAIDYEGGRDDAVAALHRAAGMAGHEGDHEIYSRTVQSTVGIGAGMIAFGVAMGALFAVVYCVCIGRVGRITPRNLALLVAGGLFLVLYAVPFVKYPANPPAVGHADTIRDRTGLYLLMVVCSGLFLLAAVWLGRRLQPRLGNWYATVAAAVGYIVTMGIVIAVLPSFGELSMNQREFGDFATETPQPLTDPAGTIVYPGFPADDLFQFRLYSFTAQAILWTIIGVGFASLAPKLFGSGDSAATPSRAASSSA